MAGTTDGVIRSGRVTLTPLAETDADAMVAVLSGADLYRFTGGGAPTLDQLRTRYRRQVAGRSADGREEWRNWIIRIGPGQRPVGYVQATIADRGRRAEMAWVVGLEGQGQGYAAEAVQAMAGWLLARGVVSLEARIHPQHAASAAVARRAGLLPAGHFDDGEQLWVREPTGAGAA